MNMFAEPPNHVVGMNKREGQVQNHAKICPRPEVQLLISFHARIQTAFAIPYSLQTRYNFLSFGTIAALAALGSVRSLDERSRGIAGALQRLRRGQ